MRVAALTLAPAYISVLASSMSPFCAAQCSAVMPSPCVVLTSAPCFSMARTASLLPCIAASTSDAGTAARRNTETHRTPIEATPIEALDISMNPSQLHLVRRDRRGRVVQIQFTGAVAELLEVVAPQHVQHREHRIGHRRAVGGLHMQAALQLAAGVAGHEQRRA